jgi:hypothetical protein
VSPPPLPCPSLTSCNVVVWETTLQSFQELTISRYRILDFSDDEQQSLHVTLL